LIGIDVTSTSRIENMYKKYQTKFLLKYLNNSEIKYINRTSTAAGFWCVKEAVSKALQVGISKELSFHDIIISKQKNGAPLCTLTPSKIEYFKIKSISISITHDAGLAIAVANIETF
jgi:holo-[acyl-carrier protein] synthase